MIKLFKHVAFWEGISLILLFFIAMPLKHFFDMPLGVKVVGMAHGLLFVAYVVIATLIKPKLHWNLTTFAMIILASLVPFGTFYMEKKYLK
jgi:integral membrane protein